jgi:hypothetical protein
VKDLTLAAGTTVQLLETRQTLAWKAVGKDVTIKMPAFDPNTMTSEYTYILKIHSINEK